MERNQNFIVRITNEWWNRLLGAVSERSLGDQEEQYASHRTRRDFVCTSIGVGAWGMVFPLLTIVATQLVGAEQAGMFSMAFITGLVLMFLGNYGVRTFQVSDLSERYSFSDYQINRVITCIAMMLVGAAYCFIRGYDGSMFTVCMGVYFYKMVDALADVYEGRLQQADKMYLAGISQAVRSVVVVLAFSLLLLITRDLAMASVAMAVVAFASFVILTFPLAHFETPKSRRFKAGNVLDLLKRCFPLFVALFLFNLIENMPKFVMEGMLPYENQLYFNALYFPAQAILLTVSVIYKPLLVRLAEVWADPARRKRFDLAIFAIVGISVALTIGVMALMSWIGIPLMSFLYGIDFEQFRGLSLVMIAAGGVTAVIDFLYQAITVLRRQRDVTKLYLLTFAFSIFIPMLLIGFTGLSGAVLSYLIVMGILLSLLVMEYVSIRLNISRKMPLRRVTDESDAPNSSATASLDSDSTVHASARSDEESESFVQTRRLDERASAQASRSDGGSSVQTIRFSKSNTAEAAHAIPGHVNEEGTRRLRDFHASAHEDMRSERKDSGAEGVRPAAVDKNALPTMRFDEAARPASSVGSLSDETSANSMPTMHFQDFGNAAGEATLCENAQAQAASGRIAPNSTERLKAVTPQDGRPVAKLKNTRTAAARSLARSQRTSTDRSVPERIDAAGKQEAIDSLYNGDEPTLRQSMATPQDTERRRIEDERDALRGNTLQFGGVYEAEKPRRKSFFSRLNRD